MVCDGRCSSFEILSTPKFNLDILRFTQSPLPQFHEKTSQGQKRRTNMGRERDKARNSGPHPSGPPPDKRNAPIPNEDTRVRPIQLRPVARSRIGRCLIFLLVCPRFHVCALVSRGRPVRRTLLCGTAQNFARIFFHPKQISFFFLSLGSRRAGSFCASLHPLVHAPDISQVVRHVVLMEPCHSVSICVSQMFVFCFQFVQHFAFCRFLLRISLYVVVQSNLEKHVAHHLIVAIDQIVINSRRSGPDPCCLT